MGLPDGDKYSRSEKSLSTLTKKFVQMLQVKNILDLNSATQTLEVNKKRRIYDITNVLEGINLVRRAGKNLYVWTGRTNNDSLNSGQQTLLDQLKDDRSQLQKEEEKLDNDLKIVKMNLAALSEKKSFSYLTKDDFISAFGVDKTILTVKDYKQIHFNFDSNCQDSNSLLLTNHKDISFRDIHIVGDVLKPTQLKLVNSSSKDIDNSSLLFFDEELSDDSKDWFHASKKQTDETKSKKRKAPWRSQEINLFRRRLTPKKFWDLEDKEREILATKVLDIDKFKNKSMFYFVNDKQLVSESHFTEPEFITLNQPPDSIYEKNYSAIAPNIHDLFDIEIDQPNETLSSPENTESENEYEMVEYLDDA